MGNQEEEVVLEFYYNAWGLQYTLLFMVAFAGVLIGGVILLRYLRHRKQRGSPPNETQLGRGG